MNDDALNTMDLLELTTYLIDVPSVSGDEKELADLVETRLQQRAPHLTVHRIGNSVVARTGRGTGQRIVFAGHLDTVKPFGPIKGTVSGDTVAGLGAVDMKGGIAVMLLLAEGAAAASGYDCTFIFYEKEETGSHSSGMNVLFSQHAGLVTGDFAVVLEPTDCILEAGCQGNLAVELEFHGVPAHSARPWQGRNAIHRAAPVLQRLAQFRPRSVEIDGLIYPQAFSVVNVAGGKQINVVPDGCTITVNYRHAPTVTTAEAAELVRRMATEADQLTVSLASPPTPPRLDHPLLRRLRERNDLLVRPKLGWTDVGRFAQHGIAAVNFGPGNPELAHKSDEIVSRGSLEQCHEALERLLLARSEREPELVERANEGVTRSRGASRDGRLTSDYLTKLDEHSAAIDELVAPARASEQLNVAYGDRYLPRPAFLEDHRVSRLAADLSRLHAILGSLPDRLFGGDIAALGRAVGMTPVQIDAVMRTAGEGPIRLARADLYEEAAGFRVLEFNIGSALGGFDNAELNRALLLNTALADFVDDAGLEFVDTLAAIADAIKTEAATVNAGSIPVVALVDMPVGYAELERRLYFAAAALARMGVDAVPCPLDRLEERSGRLFVDGRAVDVVYRFFLIEDLLHPDGPRLIEPVLRAAEQGKVALLARMDAELYGNKGTLAMLSDERHRSVFTTEEAAFLDRFVPWARPLHDERATVAGKDIDLLAFATENRRDLLLKPTLLHGGIGIVPGWTVGPDEWREAVRGALGRPYVLQRRVRPVAETFPTSGGPGMTEQFILNWGMFLAPNGYGGGIVRGSRDPDVGIVSMANGAMVGCCFHEPPTQQGGVY